MSITRDRVHHITAKTQEVLQIKARLVEIQIQMELVQIAKHLSQGKSITTSALN